ncbi:telomere repeats-binding bouquet formation protein 2 [Genypterus blacodes]|uniref:telomere repeats-binding bouquet formation protein 2 n=1 Tax=Genypterus blacodes TaxID=154954 RepID=UPI003F763761
MFRNKTAWFSRSVPLSGYSFWTSEGGTLASCRTADYLFSDDATCPDTLRIFESKDYLWHKVTVFHSSFLSACEKRQSVQSVCTGHYVLPPASVQHEVRNTVGRFIWEREEDQSVARGSHDQLHIKTEQSSSKADNGSLWVMRSSLNRYVSMENLQKYSGDLCDFYLGCFRCSACNLHCCLLHT